MYGLTEEEIAVVEGDRPRMLRQAQHKYVTNKRMRAGGSSICGFIRGGFPAGRILSPQRADAPGKKQRGAAPAPQRL